VMTALEEAKEGKNTNQGHKPAALTSCHPAYRIRIRIIQFRYDCPHHGDSLCSLPRTPQHAVLLHELLLTVSSRSSVAFVFHATVLVSR